MRAKQSFWTNRIGWNRPADEADDQADLVLVFGSSQAVSDEIHWRTLRDRHPGAILLGCSTGGEIHGCDVSDETISATALSFASTKLAAAEAQVEDQGGSFAAGQAVGRPARQSRP